jgi:hypothetical protein
VGWLVAMVLCWIGARLLIRAKRHSAPSASALLAGDRRPPVPYFRSFNADREAGKGVIFSSWFTEEEQIARALKGVGPFVAIGAPGETLPALGAARLYASDAEWRRIVHDLTSRARLVIFRLGSSPGFLWEFENVVRWVQPEQIVLLVPRDAAVYDDFRLRSRAVLPHGLPPLPRSRRRLFRGSLQAMITFDHRWVPAVTDLQALSLPLLRRSPAYPLVPVLGLAFEPVFHRLGLPWKRPGVSARMIITLGVVIAWALFMIAFNS